MTTLAVCTRTLLIAGLLAGAISLPAAAQTPTAHADTAAGSNLRDFDFVAEKIVTNYAGYDTKTTGTKRADLDALTARLRHRVETERLSADEMAALLKEWTDFFHDGHTGIRALEQTPTTPPDASQLQALAAAVPKLDWTEASVMQRLTVLGRQRDPIEGLWTISGDRYRLAILRTDAAADAFYVVVLSSTADGWSPGMVKATLTRSQNGRYPMQYRNGLFAEQSLQGELLADGSQFDTHAFGRWAREWPAVRDPQAVDRQLPSDQFFLRRLSPSTLWLRLPDFNDGNAAKVAGLLKDNAAMLEAAPNLVIDLRNNEGGSDFVYEPIIRLLYTRPIYGLGVEMRASRDNIALRRAIAEKLKSSPDAADTVAYLEREGALMEQNLGDYVHQGSGMSVTVHDEVLRSPKRVAILIDNAASSGEQFLLEARQSRKVTLFGARNSAGILDFANVVDMQSPSGRYMLHWATSRSMRLPYDPVDEGGIAPDIRIPESEADPVTYAQRWLERQVD